MTHPHHPPGFADISAKWSLLGVAVAGAVYFFLKGFGHPESGRVAGFAVGVLIGVIAMCRPLWTTRWLWALLTIIAILHATVIAAVQWPDVHYPTLMMAPLAFVDFFVIVGLVKLVDKRLAPRGGRLILQMIEIRDEGASDVAAIRAIVEAAFETAPHRSGTEAAIVDALRAAGALTISLVAVENAEVVGHVAFSPVTIDGEAGGWFGLGPVAVRPDRQRRGIGQMLIRRGLDRLRSMDAHGCVVLGDPAYYGRFGFRSDPALRYGDAPSEYFQRIVFQGAAPKGTVVYHFAFDVG